MEEKKTSRIIERLRAVRPADAILSGVGLIALVVLFAVWHRKHADMPTLSVCAAGLSVALFAVFGVRFVQSWMDEWRAVRAQPQPRMVPEPVKWTVLAKVFGVCLCAEAAALLIVFVFRVMAGNRQSFFEALSIWEHLDSQHYLDIARDWYLNDAGLDRVVQLVFLPGYPLMIRLFHLVIKNWTAAGFAVSIVSFCCAGVMLYKLARLDTDHAGALRVLKYALILPGAYFYAAPMSEGLFFLLSVSCLYAIRREKWLAVGILGGLAAFTRSLGLMLAVPAGYQLITSILSARPEGEKKTPVGRRVLQFAALLLIPAGFGVYCLISRDVSGDPFKFLVYQREHWGQKAGFFFHTAAYQTQNAIWRFGDGDLNTMIGLWIPNLVCSFGALGIMAIAVRRVKPVYSVYFMAYYIVAIGTTWLLSAPRYLLACAPLPLALSGLTKDRRADDVLTVLLMILYMFYAMCMANRWQVW